MVLIIAGICTLGLVDAVHAVITVSAHPAVGTATRHKFKHGSDTWCSHRQHLCKVERMDL